MEADLDPDGLEFMGVYMANLNTDDTVRIPAVSDPFSFNTHMAVESEDTDKGNLESEIVDPETSISSDQAKVNDDIGTQDNV